MHVKVTSHVYVNYTRQRQGQRYTSKIHFKDTILQVQFCTCKLLEKMSKNSCEIHRSNKPVKKTHQIYASKGHDEFHVRDTRQTYSSEIHDRDTRDIKHVTVSRLMQGKLRVRVICHKGALETYSFTLASTFYTAHNHTGNAHIQVMFTTYR